jgi:hypothetical protein
VPKHSDKEKLIFETYKKRLGTCSTPTMQFDRGNLIQPTPGLQELPLPFIKEKINNVV